MLPTVYPQINPMTKAHANAEIGALSFIAVPLHKEEPWKYLIDQLLRITLPDLDERSQQVLTLLENSAKRGVNMVKQLLTFTRGTTGKPITLQLLPLLQEVIGLVD
jgi:signal transduction histidine kinase